MSRGTSYNAIREAIAAGERLTRAQGKALLAYAQTYEQRGLACRSQADGYATTIRDMQGRIDDDTERLLKLIDDWDALMSMLARELDCNVYGGPGGSWVAEYDDRCTQHKSIAEAFAAMIRARMKEGDL